MIESCFHFGRCNSMTTRKSAMNEIMMNFRKMIRTKRGKEVMMWCPVDNVTRRMLAWKDKKIMVVRGREMLKDDTHCGREPYVNDTEIQSLPHDVIK